MKDSQLMSLLSLMLTRFGLELDSLDSVPAGKRRLLRVIVDGDGPQGRGPSLDDIAEATKEISVALDEADFLGDQAYTLEVSSRGTSRPLTQPRHWRRNRGRLVKVTLTGGDTLTGRIANTDQETVTLQIVTDPKRGTTSEQTFSFDGIAKALIQVELNRKDISDDAGDTEGDN